MAKKQFYGIKYPFTTDNSEKYFIDLNKTTTSQIKSLLMHLIFTPKGQKIRDPEFGTNLIKFIFEQSDDILYNDIKSEIYESVHRYIPNVDVTDIDILKSKDDFSEVYVRIDYRINNQFNSQNDSIIIKL